MTDYYFNIVVCVLIVFGGTLWIRREPRTKTGSDEIPADKEPKYPLDRPFIRAALILWRLRFLGYIAVYCRLIILHRPPADTDRLLLLLADTFTVLSVWAMLTLLRGGAYSDVGPKRTLVELCAAWTVILLLDWGVSHQPYPSVTLFPGALLDLLSWVVGIGAAVFRYRERCIPFVIIFTAYNVLQIFAYDVALRGDQTHASWVFYALAIGKVFEFLAIWELLLGKIEVEIQKPLLPLFIKLWRTGLFIVALSISTHLVIIFYPELHKTPLFLAAIIIINVPLVWSEVRRAIKKFKESDDDAQGRVRMLADERSQPSRQ